MMLTCLRSQISKLVFYLGYEIHFSCQWLLHNITNSMCNATICHVDCLEGPQKICHWRRGAMMIFYLYIFCGILGGEVVWGFFFSFSLSLFLSFSLSLSLSSFLSRDLFSLVVISFIVITVIDYNNHISNL